MSEVPPLCENESDDAPNGSYDLISSFGTYTNQKPHRVSLKKLGWINGVNPLLLVSTVFTTTPHTTHDITDTVFNPLYEK